MSRTDWGRIVLCGLVAGIIWYLLSAVLLHSLAGDFMAVVRTSAPHPRMSGPGFLAVDLAMGIWAMWLYAALRPRYGTAWRAAAITGVAWWLIKSLQSAKWVALGLLPTAAVVAPLATTLIAILAASLAGAWLYGKVLVTERGGTADPRT